MTNFSDFATLCEQLENTTGKLEKVAILAGFLSRLEKSELKIVPLFLLAKAFPDHSALTLNVSWRTVQKVFDEVKSEHKTTTNPRLTEVHNILEEIANTSGKGSRNKIHQLLVSLFNCTNEIERKYLARILFGEMRIGVAEGLVLEGIAKAANVPLSLVRQANMYLGDPGEVAGIALSGGADALKQIRLQLFRPVQPMLAGLAEDFEAVLKEHGGQTALEYKFDGARVQIHGFNDNVRIYSRHLSDVTASLPDLIEIVKKGVKAGNFVIEGEVLAVDATGRPLPFQELMRRFGRIHDIAALQKEIPIRLCLFDLLYLNDHPFIDSSYEKRRFQLKHICSSEILADSMLVSDLKEAEAFLQKAIEAGHEGLMAKKPDSDYTPGARGKKWFKIKPAETLDLVITAAEWGSGRRKGWLSNYHLAALDSESGEFCMLGKTFKGLTDAQFQWMTDKLLSLKVRETDYTVFVKPELVVEVAFNEIQRSPHYDSKFALRFARIKRIREDKKPAQADTMLRLKSLFEKQFERKGDIRSKGFLK